jgi:hypothetical protein
MTVVILNPVIVAGKSRRPGELVAVTDAEGERLIKAGDARERAVVTPLETKDDPDPEERETGDDAEDD